MCRKCVRIRHLLLLCDYIAKKLYKALIPEKGNWLELLELEDCKAYSRLSIIVCVKTEDVNGNSVRIDIFL